MEQVSRRSFLKGTLGAAGLVGAGMAVSLAGCAPQSSDLPTTGGEAVAPESYDYTADVVIVGAGGAGQMAAVSAHEAGCSTIILEKASMTGGDSITSHNDILAF